MDDPAAVRRIFVDKDLHAYSAYMDDEIVHELTAKVTDSHSLRPLLTDLLVDLRGITYAASMPSMIANGIANFHASYISGDDPRSIVIRHAHAITQRLKAEVPQLVSQSRLCRKLDKAIDRISMSYLGIDPRSQIPITAEEIWKHLEEGNPFFYGVWSTQRVAYLSAFSAYDNFVSRSTSLANHNAPCRTTDRDFNRKLICAFGEPEARTIWIGNEMKLMREIRHALAHAGGRLTRNLKTMDHCLHVIDEVVQITPRDVKSLYSTILAGTKAMASAFPGQLGNDDTA